MFCFKLEKLCLAWVLGFFVTWQAGGRAQDCFRHLDGWLALAVLDLSLSKAGMCLGKGGRGALPVWCCSHFCQPGKVAWGGEGAVGAQSPKHTQDPSRMGLCSQTLSLLPYPDPNLSPELGETMGTVPLGTKPLGVWVGFSILLPVLGRFPRSYGVGEPLSPGERKA